MRWPATILLLGLLVLPAWTRPQAIKIFPGNGRIQFEIGHAFDFHIFKLPTWATGTFDRFSGQFLYDPANLAASRIAWTAEVKSIDTGIPRRDHHLATADFFDAARYPTISFTSQSVRVLDPTHLQVSGKFTLKGVTRDVTIPVTLKNRGFDTRFSLLRSDYGFTQGLPDIADRVDIHIYLYPSPPWFGASGRFRLSTSSL